MIHPSVEQLSAVLPKPNRQWTQYFIASAKEYSVPAALIAAICWRESRGGSVLSPVGPTGTGDAGHGLGLMQVDQRYHPEFAAKVTLTGQPVWQLPEMNIAKGTEILRFGLRQFDESLEGGVACYNASAKHVMLALKEGKHPDAVTTGHDYVQEVLGNAVKWHLQNTPTISACLCSLCCYALDKRG